MSDFDNLNSEETIDKKDQGERSYENRDSRDNRRPDYYNKDQQGMGSDKRRVYMKKKVCRFCLDKTLVLDYKNKDILRRFTTEGGKIIPRRISGNCAKHQRMLAAEIKRARFIALLPYLKK